MFYRHIFGVITIIINGQLPLTHFCFYRVDYFFCLQMRFSFDLSHFRQQGRQHNERQHQLLQLHIHFTNYKQRRDRPKKLIFQHVSLIFVCFNTIYKLYEKLSFQLYDEIPVKKQRPKLFYQPATSATTSALFPNVNQLS